MRTLMDRIHVGQGSQIGSLTLFPVWSEGPAARFDVAPVNTLRAGELPNPRVAAVHLQSEHPISVLVPEGTLLAGGMQTRVLSRDIWLPAFGSAEVPTFCVEAGRWHAQGDHSVAGRAPLSVVAAVRSLPRRQGRSNQGQQEVWNSVSRQEMRYGRRETSSLVEVMRDQAAMDRSTAQEDAALKLRQLMEQLSSYQPLRGQSGILIGVAGQPVLLEVFANSRAFKNHVEALLHGLAMDVVGFPAIPTPGRRARRFADWAMNTQLEAENSETAVSNLVGRNEVLDLRALQVGSAAVHTVAINKMHELVLAA